jgi:hypothetical protein
MSKTALMLEDVIVYEGGKKIPWDVFWEVLRQLDRAETVERLKVKKKKILQFDNVERLQSVDLSNEVRLLGLKNDPDEELEKRRKRVLKKIKSLSTKLEE